MSPHLTLPHIRLPLTTNLIWFGRWLSSKRLEINVDIQTILRTVGISLPAENKAVSVTCRKEGQTTIRIDCKQALLARGPWTPTVCFLLPGPSAMGNRRWKLVSLQKSMSNSTTQPSACVSCQCGGRKVGGRTIWVCRRLLSVQVRCVFVGVTVRRG